MNIRKSLKIYSAFNSLKGLKKSNHKKKKSSVVETPEVESTSIVENTNVESTSTQTEEL
jgi:hypothetical protein